MPDALLPMTELVSLLLLSVLLLVFVVTVNIVITLKPSLDLPQEIQKSKVTDIRAN